MYKTSTKKSQTAYSVRIVCGLLFILFSVIFLSLQSPLLEALQHVLSEGKTSYSPVWGTVIITLILCIFQILINYFTRFVEYVHALSYLPSFLLLAFVTDKDRSIYQMEQTGNWGWIFIIALLLYALLIWINRQWLPLLIDKTNFPNLASRLWPNILILLLLSGMTLSLSNLDPSFHSEAKIEDLIRQGEFKQANEVGRGVSFTPSRELTALRAYTMSRADTLAHCLFEYPQLYRSEGLLLSDKIQSTFMKAEDLYNYLGDTPRYGETALSYLSRICHTESGKHPALDYYLCALLLEKKLDIFAKELDKLYFADEELPKHYKEALILYRHRHGEYEIPFDATTMEQAYQQFFNNQNSASNTYWWYYFHTNIKP